MNIVYGDLTDSFRIKEITKNNFDLMIMGEIIEHINNPVSFLEKIHSNYNQNIRKILITAPNAFCYKNSDNSKRNLEVLNSDHRFWFTPYTIAKIAVQAGYTVSEFYFTDNINKKTGMKAKLLLFPWIQRKFTYYKLKKYPGLRSNIIMIVDF